MPRSAFQDKLLSAELLRKIFTHLQSESDKFHAALICRDTAEIALDVLWQRLGSVIPLLQVLCPVRKVQQRYVLEDTVSQEARELKRFLMYAARVHHLKYGGEDELDPSVLVEIAQLTGGASLLPNIRSLHWTVNAASTAGIQMLLGPKISWLRIILDVSSNDLSRDRLPGQALCKVLSKLTQPGAHLDRLSLNTLNDVSLPRYHIDALQRLKGIKRLNLGISKLPSMDIFDLELDEDLLKELQSQCCGRCPTFAASYLDLVDGQADLEALSLNVSGLLTLENARSVKLQSLQTLFVKGPMDCILKTLQLLSAPKLKDTSVFITDCPPGPKFYKLFTALAKLSLKRIAIWSFASYPLKSQFTMSWKNMFPQHLQSSLSGLEELTILVYDIRIRMSSEDVKNLCQSWKALKVFRVRHWGYLEGRLPSMSSLVHFAQNCPHLRELRLDVRNDILLPMDCPILCHPLQKLDLMFAEWKNPEPEVQAMAHYFDCLFPWLDTRAAPNDHELYIRMLRLIDEKRRSRLAERRRLLPARVVHGGH